jgi:thymidylate kinase
MITIVVEGPDKAGKGHVMALIAKLLMANGFDVSVIGAETHNAKTLAKTEEALFEKLKTKDMKITITELQTSR